MATRIYIAAEATDLCPREHELGSYGLPRLWAFWDDRACGTSEAQPSFPRPRWRPFSVLVPPLALGSGGELTVKLLESDPLQPRPQAPFCYGSVILSSSELQPVTYRSVVISKPLERAPGKYGQLSLELSLQPLADNVRAAPSPALHLAHPKDWCGVLRFAADFGELQGRWSMEAAAFCAADGKAGKASPSSGFISWTAEGEATDVKELFIVERDVVFSAHASRENLTGKCVKRLSRMRGPGGSQCNMFVEAHPEPVPLEIVGVKQPPRMHLRFFPADFLRPRAGMPCGISLRFTLAAAPPGLELPLVIYVPSSCFSSYAQEHAEASFCISHIGDCAEVCLMDPSKLLGRSLWRLSANFSSPDSAESQSFLDVLSLKLHLGDERVLTMPLGDHAIVLRLLPSTLRLDVPRPVFGLFLPPAEAAEELRLHGAEQGEVAGIFVHSLAVHSPHVRCCFISAGPDPGTLFYPLPHMGGKVFIPAQPNENGKIVAYAFLPDFGYHAMAETAIGDACSQLHWVFNEGAKTAVLAAALITIARWPVSEGLSSASISLRVMQTSVPEQASSLLAPLNITFGQSDAFTWSGKDGEHEAILSAAAGDGMEVQCGEAVTSSFSLPELLLAQSALGFTYEEEPQEAESEESYSEEEQTAPKKLVFDEKQGMLVPTSGSDSDESREAKEARRARHRRPERSRKRPRRRVEALAPGNLSLPVIVEERQGNQSAMAFCFLPVRVQHVSERPMLQGALDAAMHRIQSPERETAGVILLQQFSAFARLDAHQDPSCQGCWEPVHALSLTATGFPGVAARASCRTAVHSFRGCAASWGVVTSSKQSPPHILKMRFATPPGQKHLDVQIEFRFTCSTCGGFATFTAFGQVQMTALWQPIDVHLAIRKDQGVIAAGHLGAAFARLMLCPSQICTQPGLLTLELQPLYPGGPGVSELLDLETNLVRSGFYGPAMHEVPAGLRLAVDKAGGPALILDGRPEDLTAAGRAKRQLCLELAPEDALTDLTLELQALTGSRRFLRSMLLAALGPLGDTAVMAFHIHFGPRCSLALLCSFEAQRHALQLRQARQPEMPIAAKPAESVPLEDPWRSSQQRRVSQALQRLRPEPGGTPRRERRAKGGTVTTGWRRSTKSHPFLERGPHHWLTDQCPYPVQRTEARRVQQTWTQEMGRQRPASAPRSKGYGQPSSPVAAPVRRNLPPGWDQKAEAKDGPKYRAEFIGRQKQKVFQLREDLQRCRVSKERMDQQMSHLRRLLRQAQQELDPKASHPRGGATKIKTIRSLRSKSQSGVKLEGSSASAEQRDESKQVCLRCEKAIPAEGRFCGGCFPDVLEEALQLREKVGKQLVQAAALRHKLDGQKREEAKLEARKCDLEARLFASEAGVQDSNTEPAQMVLATMAQLRSLRRDDEARSRLAAEQLEVLSQREAASATALDEANAQLKKANDEYDALEAQLRKGDKKVQTLLGEIEKLSSPMRNAGASGATVVHQGSQGGQPGQPGLRLPIDHPVATRAAEVSR